MATLLLILVATLTVVGVTGPGGAARCARLTSLRPRLHRTLSVVGVIHEMVRIGLTLSIVVASNAAAGAVIAGRQIVRLVRRGLAALRARGQESASGAKPLIPLDAAGPKEETEPRAADAAGAARSGGGSGRTCGRTPGARTRAQQARRS